MLQEISEVEDNEGSRPILVEFQNSNLQEGQEHHLKTAIFKQNQATIVAIASPKLLYTGNVTRDKDQDLHKRFLVISNRRTGKVRLVAVDTVLLTPQFAQRSSDTTSVKNANSVNKLNKAFGSKKIKKITEQRERMTMNIDDVREQLEQTVAGIELDESAPLVAQIGENDSNYRPPIHRDASSREEVYILEEIVPSHVLNSLEDESREVLDSDLDSLDLTPMIRDKLAQMQNTSPNLAKCKLLLYLDYLIKFVTKLAKNITKRCVICPSTVANSHILNNFTVSSNSGRTRPLSMRDKTVCYILVIAMIAFDYEVDFEQLAKIVKIGVKKLLEMGRILAFSSDSKKKNSMTLKLPLPASVTSSSPQKRKRK
ncbi:DNA-directed RNA polymerase I subunit RPA49-like [Tribolium madens]|uniref:DNA-directed RNA polymerase I subunit RPA49-like n=1 Tax=Tribolium madens TaxID=41895 RepID=UPI001CF730F3|nr:DNA-directed RNA polymerase I subunit RPA49-like [Tribolium madens]